jgi:hypothetical protein
MVALALRKYTQDRLLGDVWKRPDLSRRDRSLVTLDTLFGRNLTIGLSDQLKLALDRWCEAGVDFGRSSPILRSCRRWQPLW